MILLIVCFIPCWPCKHLWMTALIYNDHLCLLLSIGWTEDLAFLVRFRTMLLQSMKMRHSLPAQGVWFLKTTPQWQVCWLTRDLMIKVSGLHLLKWLLLPKISMHILHTLLCTFPKVLTRRICVMIKSFFSWWSFPSFSCSQCVIQGWYCEEKLDAGHS